MPRYPSPPWRLRGWAYQTIQPVAISAVRLLVPCALRIVPVWPGKTLGCVVVASYERGSTLAYHELAVLPALVWSGGRLGFWVSHMYVDSPASVAGGREIWGLPKELAEFTVEERASGRSITVRQGNRALCTLHVADSGPWGARLTLPLSAFGMRNDQLLFFAGEVRSRLGLVATRVEIPPDGPLARLGLNRPWRGLFHEDLDLLVRAPKLVAV